MADSINLFEGGGIYGPDGFDFPDTSWPVETTDHVYGQPAVAGTNTLFAIGLGVAAFFVLQGLLTTGRGVKSAWRKAKRKRRR